MSELVVYGTPASQPVRSVLFFLKQSGIEYTYKEVSLMKGENMTEEFTKINPFQSLPAIVHDGFNLWESAAIVSYLADAYNVDNQWYPKDPRVRGRINAFLHWHHQNIRAPLVNYLWAKYYGPKVKGAPQLTEETERPLKEGLQTWYENFEWLLNDTGFVARTEKATIADVFAYNEITLGLLIPMDLDAHPKIRTWFDNIGNDPVIQELLSSALDVIKHWH